MGADAHGVVQRGWVCTATQWIQGWELSSLSAEQSLLRKDLRRIKLQGTKQVECIPLTSHWKNLLVSLCEISPMYFSIIIMANIY